MEGGDRRQMMWNLKGRSAVAAIDPSTRHRIMQSHTMASCFNKPLLAVLEALITVKYVGGLTGPLHKPEPFICLIARLLQITPNTSIVLAMLQQDVHKYLRVAALFVIRLIGNETMIREAMRVGWEDYRKIRVYGDMKDLTGITNSNNNNNNKKNNENDNVADDGEDEIGRMPSFAIMCVDEITDRLFHMGDGEGNSEGTSGNVWLGLRLPPMFL